MYDINAYVKKNNKEMLKLNWLYSQTVNIYSFQYTQKFVIQNSNHTTASSSGNMKEQFYIVTIFLYKNKRGENKINLGYLKMKYYYSWIKLNYEYFKI